MILEKIKKDVVNCLEEFIFEKKIQEPIKKELSEILEKAGVDDFSINVCFKEKETVIEIKVYSEVFICVVR